MAKVPFVHSNFERVKDDFYPTIDKRCIYSFLQHFSPDGLCIDVCAPDGSGIVDTINECGFFSAGIADAFQENARCSWIVTNPPYKRPLVDEIIYRQIERVNTKQIGGLAVLLRANFDFAKSRKNMFELCPHYFGQIKMRFRPKWFEETKASPIHNYVWHIWKHQAFKIHPIPVTLYSDGENLFAK